MRRGTTLTTCWRARFQWASLAALAVAAASGWALAVPASAPAHAKAAAGRWQRLEAERLRPAGRAGTALPDHRASGRRTLALGRGRASGRVALRSAIGALTLRVRTGSCRRADLTLSVDGRRVLARSLLSRTWTHLRGSASLGAGRHRVVLEVSAPPGCAVRIDSIGFRPTSSAPRTGAPSAAAPGGASLSAPALLTSGSNAAGDPFAGQRFYVEPDSPPTQTEAQWRAAGRTADANQMHKLAATPQAWWAGGWRGDIRAAVAQRLATAHAQGATTDVLVTWNADVLTQCSAAAAQRYAAWIREFAAGIGGSRAIVILEADGLPGLGDCPPAGRPILSGMVRDAIGVLAALPATSVYVDAGNSGWVPATEMAARLRDVGVARVRGISLNVANFNTTAAEIAYGRAVLAALNVPGERLVIDTGRNGQGPAPGAAHCNPPGRGLGSAPTVDTGDPAVDAFFWFKRPGESDDNAPGCSDAGPAPPSGAFWADYALGLAQRSAM